MQLQAAVLLKLLFPDEEVVDPDDVEMLEDLLVAAVNEALEKVDAETTSAMSKFTGGMGGGMPGLF